MNLATISSQGKLGYLKKFVDLLQDQTRVEVKWEQELIVSSMYKSSETFKSDKNI